MNPLRLIDLAYAITSGSRFSSVDFILKDACQPMPEWLDIAIRENQQVHYYSDNLISLIPELLTHLAQCNLCFTKYYRKDTPSYAINEHNDEIHICAWCLNNCHIWHSDGLWHTTPEPRRPCLTSYHGSDRYDLYAGVNFKDPRLLGLELETYINGNATEVEKVALGALKLGVQVEHDSSLDYFHGAEFIFRPVPLNEIVLGNYIHRVTSYLQDKNVIAWNAGNNYGMHITVNAHRMTNLHLSKFCAFLNESKELCEIVAGRPENRWAQYIKTPLKHAGRDNKYLAASIRSRDRCEVRIFRASLYFPRIRRNCEFVDSIREFTKQASIRDLSIKNYLSFLEQPSCYKQYDQIRSFLRVGKKTLHPSVLSKEIAFSKEEFGEKLCAY